MKLTIFTRSLCLLLFFGPLFLGVNGFFFDKLERFKKITLPGYASSLGFSLPGLSNTQGVRVCINFASNMNYPQGYQQNTCFFCDNSRYNQIASYCTGQTSIPSNINYTQANCIMNSCQPMQPNGAVPSAVPRFPTNFLAN